MGELLHISGLSKKYGTVLALDKIDLTIQPGKVVGLLGPNGSGKTTLIKLINGLLIPSEGCLCINGHAHIPLRTYRI